MAERVAVYVDGANAYFAQKEALGWWIDWPRFLSVMKEGRDLVSARWYQAYRSSPEPDQERFLHHLTLVGFAVRKKTLKTIHDRHTGQIIIKGNLDIELAIDALTESPHYDTAILVTGDSDFVPLVEALSSRGKRVCVVATQQNVAVELRQSVGVNYLDLRDLRNQIESDKRVVERLPERDRFEHAPGKDLPGHDDDYDRDEEFDGEFDDEHHDDESQVAHLGHWNNGGNGDSHYDDPPPPRALDDEDIELPQEGETVRCRVQAVKKYGVFLDLHQDAKTLLHVKDMNRGYVADAGEYYRVGQELTVQVVSIDRTRMPPEVRVTVQTPEMEY